MAAHILMALLLKFLISYFSSLPCNMHAMLSLFSYVRLFATLWSVACSLLCPWSFSRQEYCNGLPCPPPGSFPDLGIKLMSPVAPTPQEDSLPLSQWGSPSHNSGFHKMNTKGGKKEKKLLMNSHETRPDFAFIFSLSFVLVVVVQETSSFHGTAI